MSDKNTYIEQVGAYLDGDLTGGELNLFESELASNKSLAQEVSSQKELIEGIKSYRKSELIARLDNLSIGSAGIITSSLTKFIGGAVILGGIGFGLYQWMMPVQKTTENIETPIEEQIEVPKEEISQMEPDEQIKPAKSIDVAEVPSQKPSTSNEKQKEVIEKQVVIPVVPNPEVEDDNEVEDDLEIPDTNIGTTDITEKSGMEVDIVIGSNYSFHYRVVRGNLTLYGNFNEEPYQIIEINVEKEKQWYLYFKEIYYSIDKSVDEITPLRRISNESLIHELEKVKNKNF